MLGVGSCVFCLVLTEVLGEAGRSFPMTGAAVTDAPAAGWQSAAADKA